MSKFALHIGGCLDILPTLPPESVDSIVTDPPYGLGFMGKAWDKLPPGVEVMRECLRVLKPGGHLLAFGGSRTYHRLAVAVEDAGFEIRDQIMWLYGSGFPKSRNIGKELEDWDGWGTALKPAHEPIVVARKPLAGTVAANVHAHGTGALNIDGCRVAMGNGEENPSVARRKGAVNHLSDRPAAETEAEGRMVSRQSPEAFQAERHGETLGRWPANVIHDGSEDVLAEFARYGEKGAAAPVRGTEASAASTGNVTGKRDRVKGAFHSDQGSAARFFYCAKASRADRNEGLTDPGPQFQHGNTLRKVENTATKGNNHPTVKPTSLMAYLVRLVTPPGGTVLDPFMGSGSTGKAAIQEGMRFIGIELDEDEDGEPLGYGEIARARLIREVAKLKEKEQQPELEL